MTKIKNMLLIMIIPLLINSALFSENIIIRVSGKEYSREIPNNIKDSQILIKQLAELVNNADDEIILLNNKMYDERKDYTNKLNDVTAKLDEANKKLEDTEKVIETLDKDITRLTKVDTRCTMFLITGPTVNLGMFVNIGIDYRIFRNFHIGASINSSIFTNTESDGSIGIGLLLGYSIY